MKIAVNKCYGGFSLSMHGYKRYFELMNKEIFFYKQTSFSFNKNSDGKNVYTKIKDLDSNDSLFHCVSKDLGDTTNELPNDCYIYLYKDEIRTDPLLIQTIEELGKKASSQVSNIVITEIPNDIKWVIDDYDGIESVHEQHRSW